MPHPDFEPPEMRSTTWKNPTKRTVSIDVFVGASRRNPSGRQNITIPPGGTKDVPSQFDRAIRKVRNGRVEGGLAPQLVKVGEKPLPIHPSLDMEAQARKEARSKAQRAMDAKRMAESLVSEAADTLAEAEASGVDEADDDSEPDQARGQSKSTAGQQRPTGRK